MMAEIVAVCSSLNKGERKKNISTGLLLKNEGLEGDAHAGFKHRQVSLLAEESIEKMIAKGLEVGPGDFAENLTTRGIDLPSLPLKTRLKIGEEAILRVSQIGKECHDRCAIYHQAGDCVMPREGIFAEVIKSGRVSTGDSLKVIPSYSFAIITASDKGSRGEREDLSGPAIAELLEPFGEVAEVVVVPDDRPSLAGAMRDMASKGVDAIFTSGGTGLSPRDVTPEATLDVIERRIPGIPEAIRRQTFTATEKAMLSRGEAGVLGRTLIINLPGSPRAVKECFSVVAPVLEHALETVSGQSGDCARA